LSTTTAASVKDQLLKERPHVLVARWFLEDTPALFKDRASHVAWKRDLAELLRVSVFDLIVVGSAAVGISLNPAKNFKAFAPTSDIDLALVSAHHFDVSWRWLRGLGAGLYRLPEPAQNWVREHERRLVYWGTIATDQLLAYMPFGHEWVPHLSTMSGQDPAQGREINVRLYRDFASLEAYQVACIKKLRLGLTP